MENATHALIMAFTVFIFVIALTVSMVSLNSVKRVSDAILYTKDETNYYTYTDVKGKASENRIVGLETIIPTLYKYYKENYTVVFKEAKYDYDTGNFIGDWEYLTVYNTVPNRNWEEVSYENLMNAKYKKEDVDKELGIFSFDIDEETLRHEPWTGSEDKAKENIDCFLNGTVYKNPNNGEKYKNYSDSPGGFIEKYKDEKFVETIQEYKYTSTQSFNTTISGLTKEKTKRMIIFTHIKN